MASWAFLLGVALTLALLLPAFMYLFVRWGRPASRSDGMIKGLVEQLAKSERELGLYKDAYEHSSQEVDDLRREKLSAWGIPEKLP